MKESTKLCRIGVFWNVILASKDANFLRVWSVLVVFEDFLDDTGLVSHYLCCGILLDAGEFDICLESLDLAVFVWESAERELLYLLWMC